MAHILVVEDNEDLAFGLSRSLEGEGYTVDIAPDGPSGARLAMERRPALVLLDLMLPGMDGFLTLETMRRAGLTMPVILLTARGAEVDKVHGLRLGADDYVTKPFGLSELMARVAAHLRRAASSGAPGPADVLRFADVEIQPAARVVTKRGARVALTPREYELLLAFVRRPDVVHSRVALLRDVWGHAADVQTRTVDIHVAELRRKLEDDPVAPRHFVTVWKAGYRFEA